MKAPHQLGRQAALEGRTLAFCPYQDREQILAWCIGYHETILAITQHCTWNEGFDAYIQMQQEFYENMLLYGEAVLRKPENLNPYPKVEK